MVGIRLEIDAAVRADLVGLLAAEAADARLASGDPVRRLQTRFATARPAGPEPATATRATELRSSAVVRPAVVGPTAPRIAAGLGDATPGPGFAAAPDARRTDAAVAIVVADVTRRTRAGLVRRIPVEIAVASSGREQRGEPHEQARAAAHRSSQNRVSQRPMHPPGPQPIRAEL